MVHLGRLHAL
jgi:NAD(P)-dependent dehydrogenase (short-subunit alcohol dehydrogenase family)